MSQPKQFLVTGVYWRKSKLNGRKCVPVILWLREAVFAMTDADALVFEVPVSQVRAHFTRLGTMKITVNGTSYDIVGKGSNVSPAFTPAQREQLQNASAGRPHPGNPLIMAGVFGGVGAVASVPALASGMAILHRFSQEWRAALTAAGATIE